MYGGIHESLTEHKNKRLLALAGQPSYIPMAEAREFTKDLLKAAFSQRPVGLAATSRGRVEKANVGMSTLEVLGGGFLRVVTVSHGRNPIWPTCQV